MWQAKLWNSIGVCAVLLLLAAVMVGSARAQVIYEDKLLTGLPGPDALYDPDQGEPQALLPEPREVLFPVWACPRQTSAWRCGRASTIGTA